MESLDWLSEKKLGM